MDDGGAIFCDGQFVNAKSANSCADEIKAKLDIDIDIRAEVSNVAGVAVDGTKDAVDATKKKSKELCSVTRVGDASPAGASAALAALGAITLVARRTRRR
jgi:MYXO-CTERM domain-containing protein